MIEQNSHWNIDGGKWTVVFVDHNVEKALCVSYRGGKYCETWVKLSSLDTIWREPPYKHVTELWIAEGAPVMCRFTGLARDCQSKTEFPGAKKYRITTEEIVE